MASVKQQLAARLRSAREKRGLTQAAVAKALGVHRPTISEIEAGRRSVAGEELSELSRLYGMSASELLPPASPVDTPGANAIESTISQMAAVIAGRFDPERIILFGSHARGSAGPDSDVDLLVLMEVPGSKRRMAARIGAALHQFQVPKDIIVTTPHEFEQRKDVVGTIERPAAREGRVLYVRR